MENLPLRMDTQLINEMRRVEILYDFDFAAVKYYKQGLNDHPSKRFSHNVETYYPLESIGMRDSLESLYLLGGGLDKICIADSESHKCFILEPCPAIFFILQMEEVFNYFMIELKNENPNPSNGGIFVTESLFRNSGDRGEFEIHVGVSFDLDENEKWQIHFQKSGQEKILDIPLDIFLSAYFEFGERMIRFYDYVLPEYKAIGNQYTLFIKAVRESVILKKFEVKPQSNYDDKTYYDYQ